MSAPVALTGAAQHYVGHHRIVNDTRSHIHSATWGSGRLLSLVGHHLCGRIFPLRRLLRRCRLLVGRTVRGPRRIKVSCNKYSTSVALVTHGSGSTTACGAHKFDACRNSTVGVGSSPHTHSGRIMLPNRAFERTRVQRCALHGAAQRDRWAPMPP
jgi:hypothetical protein